MKLYKVYPECFKVNDGKNCLHWVIQSYSSKPIFMWNFEINNYYEHGLDKDHFTNLDKPNFKGCGNPFNTLTDEEIEKVRKAKPEVTKVKYDTYTITLDNDDTNETFKDSLQSTFNGDTWSFYKVSKYNEPIETYYNSYDNNIGDISRDKIKDSSIDYKKIIQGLKDDEKLVMYHHYDKDSFTEWFRIGDKIILFNVTVNH